MDGDAGAGERPEPLPARLPDLPQPVHRGRGDCQKVCACAIARLRLRLRLRPEMGGVGVDRHRLCDVDGFFVVT